MKCLFESLLVPSGTDNVIENSKGGGDQLGVIHRKYIKGALSILMYSFVAVSLIWTFLSVGVFIRTRLQANARPDGAINIVTDDEISLPRIDDDSLIQDLAGQLSLLADRETDTTESDNYFDDGPIIASINFKTADSTYFYRLVYLEECDCPTRKLDRYDIYLEYINPHSLRIFKKYHYERLSAEDVNRFDELVTLERR